MDRRQWGERLLTLALALLGLLVVLGCLGANWRHGARLGGVGSDDWRLVLVNEWSRVPPGYEVELVELSNGERVDARIYPDLQELFDAARAEGLRPFVREGYRTQAEQQEILDATIEGYREEGHSRFWASVLAERYVAAPGTSEHELGLAVDINAEDAGSSDELFAWLEANSHRYGFVLRYPPGKQHATGKAHEAWHYRYVGREAAAYMHEHGLCLEEYLEERATASP